MAQAAVKIKEPGIAPERDIPAIRRFQEPDLCEHGGWIMERMKKTYPQHNDRYLANWLRGLIEPSDNLFLYREHAVAFAQRVRTFQLNPIPIVWERFVWAEDPQNPEHVASAADFYNEFLQWAKSQEIDKIIVAESSDVPLDTIKERLGRLYELRMTFAKV